MMRILLASGEEAVYRTVDELALGISSGTVTSAARFFDSPSQGWRSIDSHPEYQEAVARAAVLVPAAGIEPVPFRSASHLPEADQVARPQKIYQMFSQSAAELQARRRLAWLLPTLAGVAGMAMVVSVLSVRWATRHQPAHEPVDHLVSSAGTIAPEGGSNASSSFQAMRLAPVNLHSHLVYAMEAAGRQLGDTVQAMRITGLLSPARLASPDSARQVLSRLGVLRTLIQNFRTTQVSIVAAYRDTAAMLARTGFWSRVDQQEWRAFPPASESAAEAAQADTLLGLLERLYTLTADQESGRGPSGQSSVGNPEHEQLRAALARFASGSASAGERPQTALSVLQESLSAGGSSTRP